MSAFQVWNLVVTHSSRVDVKASNSSSDLFSFPIESEWRQVRIFYGHHRIERHLNSACKKMKQFRLCLTLWRSIYACLDCCLWFERSQTIWEIYHCFCGFGALFKGSQPVGRFGTDSRKRSALIALFSDGLAGYTDFPITRISFLV